MVHSEGDVFQFPYSPSSTEVCLEEGCCGCPGQCSKCPPLLSGCTSWELDGLWEVAYDDGYRARYTFDAHGHVEILMPKTSIPRTWKSYPDTYIENGHDVKGTPQWFNVSAAKEYCTMLKTCKGITYNVDSKKTLAGVEVFLVFFKEIIFITHAPGTGWQSFLEDPLPELGRLAVIAGPLVQNKTSRDTFTFDFHRAAPKLFPPGTHEVITFKDSGLLIERFVNEVSVLNATGLSVQKKHT